MNTISFTNRTAKGYKRSIKNIKRHKRSIKNIPKASNNTTEISENNIKKNKCYIPKPIIIIIILMLIFCLISMILLILLKKIKQSNKEIIHDIFASPLEIPINRDIANLKYSFNNFPIIISNSEISFKKRNS